VTYGKKLSAAKKPLDFKGHMEAGGFAVAEVKEGTKSLTCAPDSFGGVDPSGEDKDAPRACFCDQKKKMFNKDSLKSIQDLWKAKATIPASNLVMLLITICMIVLRATTPDILRFKLGCIE
jgi:hypothetical protein